MCTGHANGIETQVVNVRNGCCQEVFRFFNSDEVIENNIFRGGVGRECERQEVPPSCSEQSVSIEDEELRKFLEEQKNCKTQNKTHPT